MTRSLLIADPGALVLMAMRVVWLHYSMVYTSVQGFFIIFIVDFLYRTPTHPAPQSPEQPSSPLRVPQKIKRVHLLDTLFM